jgi:hypothetical protein
MFSSTINLIHIKIANDSLVYLLYCVLKVILLSGVWYGNSVLINADHTVLSSMNDPQKALGHGAGRSTYMAVNGIAAK